jgi:hypothetical protein
MISAPNRSVALSGSVESCILQLGIAAVSTSWPDGAACDTIGRELTAASTAVLDIPDRIAVLRAKSSLKICAALECPRLPALGIVKRSDGFLSRDNNSITILTAESIAEQLQQFQHQDEELTRINREATKDDDKSDPQETIKKKNSQNPKISMDNSSAVTELLKPASIDNPSFNENVTNKPIVENNASLDGSVKQAFNSKESEKEKQLVDELEDSKPSAKMYRQTLLERHDHDEEDENDLPMIVDCGPDEEDM